MRKIPIETIKDLCESAGLKPDDVAEIVIKPEHVFFHVYLRNASGAKYVVGTDEDPVISSGKTYWKVPHKGMVIGEVAKTVVEVPVDNSQPWWEDVERGSGDVGRG